MKLVPSNFGKLDLGLGNVQMGVRCDMKKWFFDQDRVKKRLASRTLKVLGHFGGLVRKIAMQSIKSKPFGAISPPGHPPFDHIGYGLKMRNKARKAAGLAKEKQKGFKGIKHIYYALNRGIRSVVIGPVASHGVSDTLPALEYGGTSRVWSYSRRNRTVVKVAHIRPHPFMTPAFAVGKRKLPKLWAQAQAII